MQLRQNSPRVLVCDDQYEVGEALRLLLKAEGFQVENHQSPATLLSAAATPSSLLLLDMNYTRDTTSGEEGLALIRQLRQHGVDAPIIAMTAWGDIALAVAALQSGASDFLEKPWHNDRLRQMALKWHAASTRSTSELSAASAVQRTLLPPVNTGLPLDFACRFLPARDLSGDYYDFFPRGPERHGFVLADVSGKGVPAALLMANLQGLFRSHARLFDLPAASLLATINTLFHQSTPADAYATAFYAEFDAASSTLTYASCGHPPAFLHRASGEVLSLHSGGWMLGAFPHWPGQTSTLTLHPGDRLFLFSDGALEAANPAGEDFGPARLQQWLTSAAHLPPAMALDNLEQQLTHHSGPHLADDCTLLLATVR